MRHEEARQRLAIAFIREAMRGIYCDRPRWLTVSWRERREYLDRAMQAAPERERSRAAEIVAEERPSL